MSERINPFQANVLFLYHLNKLVKVFKNVSNKICGGQPLKNLKAFFHKFYLVHFWKPWPKSFYWYLFTGNGCSNILEYTQVISKSVVQYFYVRCDYIINRRVSFLHHPIKTFNLFAWLGLFVFLHALLNVLGH